MLKLWNVFSDTVAFRRIYELYTGCYGRIVSNILQTISSGIFLKISARKSCVLHQAKAIVKANTFLDVCHLLPAANEVWGKVIFLHLSVILFTGGVCPIACWDTPTRDRGRSPGSKPPPEQTPPRSRHTPGTRARQPPPPRGSRQSPREQTSTPWADPPRSRHSPAQCMLGDTGSKRTVHILLECNLVLWFFLPVLWSFSLFAPAYAWCE